MSSGGLASITSSFRVRGCWERWGAPGMAWGRGWPAAPSRTITACLPASLRRSAPTLLTDFRFGYFKYNPQTQKPDGGAPMTAFGIPGANTSDPKTAGLGFFALGADPISGQGCTQNSGSSGCVISSFGDGLGVGRCNCPLTESEQQFQFVNNWTKTRGNHIFKFGADIRYAENLRIPSDNNRTGEFNFSPEATSNGRHRAAWIWRLSCWAMLRRLPVTSITQASLPPQSGKSAGSFTGRTPTV